MADQKDQNRGQVDVEQERKAQQAQAAQKEQAEGKTGNISIPDYLQGLPVQVDVLLGSVKLSVKELLSCGPGSVIDIGKKATEPFDLFVNGTLIARGEVVMMHDRLGLKVVEVVDKPALLS